jgi:hypothetical protein
VRAEGGLFPLFPKTGNVNARQQNAALCHKQTNAPHKLRARVGDKHARELDRVCRFSGLDVRLSNFFQRMLA